MSSLHLFIFEPFIRPYVHCEGVVCYHATEEPGPSDCVWIMPGTLNINE